MECYEIKNTVSASSESIPFIIQNNRLLYDFIPLVLSSLSTYVHSWHSEKDKSGMLLFQPTFCHTLSFRVNFSSTLFPLSHTPANTRTHTSAAAAAHFFDLKNSLEFPRCEKNRLLSVSWQVNALNLPRNHSGKLELRNFEILQCMKALAKRKCVNADRNTWIDSNSMQFPL